MNEYPELERAIECFDTQDAFALAIGVKSPSISEWKKRGKVPAERCADIERATEGQVTRSDLRPDLWEPAPKRRKAA